MAKATTEQLALDALSAAVVDPEPKILHGTKAKPCIFTSAAAGPKKAADLLVANGWIEETGEFQKSGRTKKPLFRITANGIQYALENSDALVLLNNVLDSLAAIEQLQIELNDRLKTLPQQKEIVQKAANRLQPPDLTRLRNSYAMNSDWHADAVSYIENYQRRNPSAYCPLPELYRNVCAALGAGIGQFHDGLRHMVQEKKIRLHPFTGAAYQLTDEQYALVAAQEIKYYAGIAND